MAMSVRDSKGFTLIEALVSIFLLAVVLLGLLAAVYNAMVIDTKSYLRMKARALATECIENVKKTKANLGSTNCSGGTVTVNRVCTDSSGVNLYIDKFRKGEARFKVAWNLGGTDVKRLDIKVCWEYAGKSYEYTLFTFLED